MYMNYLLPMIIRKICFFLPLRVVLCIFPFSLDKLICGIVDETKGSRLRKV